MPLFNVMSLRVHLDLDAMVKHLRFFTHQEIQIDVTCILHCLGDFRPHVDFDAMVERQSFLALDRCQMAVGQCY